MKHNDLLINAANPLQQQIVNVGKKGIATMAPAILKSRFPKGNRRASMGALAVVSTAKIPLPRLAPTTSPRATVSGTKPETAKVAVSKTMAKLE
ncbi:hypothetical protein LepocDRAFT_00000150 [Leptothrix ochracea L12]|uniref:Uncharacterized protein n=1 Tax=Leptothrix ochracea L12 TaxID=735332 RepID=I4Z4Z6_9BURK|nr:hypothetical protein LepocDRAFT_00000150 [Leptothrix ochracea L12]